MSERKVLNKYYPPDFDPRKLPRLRLSRDRQFVIRIMAPMSIKCTNCAEYIYKGKKFNARQETVQNENYLGLRIYRFYIKCPRCMSEITFKTDPKNADYTMEQGGTRCFDAAKLAARAREKELEQQEEEEEANPMLALEKRTKESKMEMESLEKLEELKELNRRHADIDHEQLLDIHTKDKLNEEEIDLKLEEERDEQLTKDTFKNKVISTKDIGGKFDFSNVFSTKVTPINKDKSKQPSNSNFVVIRKKTAGKSTQDSLGNPAKVEDKSSKPNKLSALVAYGSSDSDS